MKTRFQEIFAGTEEYVSLQRYAESFDHIVKPRIGHRTFAFLRECQVFGYADISYLPVAFPSFHPKYSTPRAVKEVLSAWQANADFNSGGIAMIGVPLDESRTTFPKEMLEGQGMHKLERELYTLGG